MDKEKSKFWNKKAVLEEADRVLHPDQPINSAHPLSESLVRGSKKILRLIKEITITPVSYSKQLYKDGHSGLALGTGILTAATFTLLPLALIASGSPKLTSALQTFAVWEGFGAYMLTAQALISGKKD